MSYSIVRRRPNASLLAEAVRTIGKRRFEIRQQVSCPLEDRKLHYLVETWFFFPQSLQINRWSYTATDYQQSLKNYIRLGVPIRPLESLLGGELPPPLRKLEAEEGGGEEIIELTLPEQFPDILEDCSRRLDDLLWQNTPETRERYEDSLKLFCIAFRVSLLARKNAVLAIEDGELVEAFPGKRILAIDADPAVGLSTALGVHVEHTIDDIRNEVIETSERGEYRQAIEVLNEARFRIFDTMVECDGFAFLAIGRPEAAGCYCSVNSYLKEVISMLANDFDYVVIDGEAGIEQISRRVMEQVSHLVLVTDQSAKGVNVCRDDLITYERIGMIVNRVVDPSMNDLVKLDGVDVLAYIPTDPIHAANDIHGKSVFELPEDSNIMVGVHQALHNLGIF